MAVDYLHYLVVSGPLADVSGFADRIALVVSRKIAGSVRQTTVPFSFESLYAIAKLKDDPPFDPYDIRRWPLVRRGRGRAEVRYRFHTRNMEVDALLKKLSRKVPRLLFALVTHCLDDSTFGAYTMVNGRCRGGYLQQAWQDAAWQQAADAFSVELSKAYEDDEVDAYAERLMLDGAVRIATGFERRYDWSGGRVYRDLDVERDRQLAALLQARDAKEG